jgi:cell division protein FtsI (penicillin-binding protein 3)
MWWYWSADMSERREKKVRKLQRAERTLPSYVGRRRTVLVLFAVAACALIWRAVDRQVIQKDFLQAEGADRYLDTVEVPAHRGLVTDRNSAVLAVSTPVDSVAANPRVLRLDADSLRPLAKALGMGQDELRNRLARYSNRHFVYLQRRLPPAKAKAVMAVVKAHDLKGVHLEREYRRYYPGGEVFAHLIGFTNVDDQGQEGLELAYDKALAGEPGIKRVMRDGRRQVVEDVESIRLPRPGKNLALSIDQRLQFTAYRELKAAVIKHRAVSASAVLLDVQTGEVLAMVNQPSYNPNGSHSNRAGRLRNRAITDVFEPGSTMKPFTVAAALELGKVRPDTRIDTSPGYMKVGRAMVRDHHNLGVIDLATLLSKSSNVGAGKLALSLPREEYWGMLSRLGFGEPTGIGFPGEVGGQLTNPANWALIDQATLSFGYGVSVTTLQLAQAYAVLAADGMRYPLSLLHRSERPTGQRVMNTHTARAVRHLLEGVVNDEGTGTRAHIPGYRVAGKTGTAKKVGPDGYSNKKYRALFAGMAPASNPRLVLAVMVDEPRDGKIYGGQVAAPVFAAIMGEALRVLNVPPDNRQPGKLRLARLEKGA